MQKRKKLVRVTEISFIRKAMTQRLQDVEDVGAVNPVITSVLIKLIYYAVLYYEI